MLLPSSALLNNPLPVLGCIVFFMLKLVGLEEWNKAYIHFVSYP